jgi:hypothetical protein
MILLVGIRCQPRNLQDTISYAFFSHYTRELFCVIYDMKEKGMIQEFKQAVMIFSVQPTSDSANLEEETHEKADKKLSYYTDKNCMKGGLLWKRKEKKSFWD